MPRRRQLSERALAAQKQVDAALAAKDAPKRPPGRPRKNPLPPAPRLEAIDGSLGEVEVIEPKPKAKRGRNRTAQAQHEPAPPPYDLNGDPEAALPQQKAAVPKKPVTKKKTPAPKKADSQKSDEGAPKSQALAPKIVIDWDAPLRGGMPELYEAYNAEADEDFAREPSDEFFVGALKEGLADGTIVLSDSEDEDDDEYEEEEDEDTKSNILGPVTSTPYVRKKAPSRAKKSAKAPRARRVAAATRAARAAMEEEFFKGPFEAKINVHDGAGVHLVRLQSTETRLSALGKIAAAMFKENHEVDIGYEAPWSAKIGNKKVTQYITNDDEWVEFWNSYKNTANATGNEHLTGIVICNMRDSHMKPAGRVAKAKAKGKEVQVREPQGTAVDPRSAAREKLDEATAAIQIGMKCKHDHGSKLCYIKYNGHCGTYTHEIVAEHAALLAAGTADVKADAVPAQLRSKLLDYFRPGKNARAAGNRDLEDREEPIVAPVIVAAPAPVAATEAAVHTGPLDYPSVKTWLEWCGENFERGRDKHGYMELIPVFIMNGCTRIDDIARLSDESIISLGAKEGIKVTIGLAGRLRTYAIDDVAIVKREGRLEMR